MSKLTAGSPTMPSNKWEEALDRILQEHGAEAGEFTHSLKQALTNAVRELIKEARIAETKLWYNEWGNGQEQIGDGSWEDYYESRLAALQGK